jgi:hypothetical protein
MQEFIDLDTSQPGVATYTHTVNVKLCSWYNFLQSLVVFHLAPWAQVRVKYSIYRKGKVEVEFSGSGIPSQFNYVDWALFSQHQMETIGQAEVMKFLTAGNCNPAPWVARSVYP